MVLLCFAHVRAPYGVEVGVRVSRRGWGSRVSQGSLVGSFLAHFSHVFAFLSISGFITIFHRFFIDFGRVFGGFWEAEIAPGSKFGMFFGRSFSKPKISSIFARFWEWRPSIRLAVAQSKRMSAILDEGPKNIKKSPNFDS